MPTTYPWPLTPRCMSRATGSPPLLPAPDPVSLESEPIAEEGALEPPEPIQGAAQPVRRSLGKVPKWLKLPGACLSCTDWVGQGGWAAAQERVLTLVFVSQPARGESYQPREVHHQPQDPTPPIPSRNKDSRFSQGPPIFFSAERALRPPSSSVSFTATQRTPGNLAGPQGVSILKS